MPRYAVEFVADIQEVTGAVQTESSDCHCPPLVTSSVTEPTYSNTPLESNKNINSNYNSNHNNPSSTHSPSQNTTVNNVVTALMGNAQCCFKRFPGNQAHRHVVVSRGIQCSQRSETPPAPMPNIPLSSIPSKIESEQSIALSPTNERGDMFHNQILGTNGNNQYNDSVMPLKPEVFTPLTYEPPELRESSKFMKNNFNGCDTKKYKKLIEDDIDSLSATISNYSFHEKLLKFDLLNDNNKATNQNYNESNVTPCPKRRQNSLKESNEAIRGSTTKTVTLKSLQNNEITDFQSSDISQLMPKENAITNSGDSTVVSNVVEENIKCIESEIIRNCKGDNKFMLDKPIKTPSQNSLQNKILSLFDKPNKSPEPKPATSVTFVRGSEELKGLDSSRSVEIDNLNILRRKQKFIMRHTRTNSKSHSPVLCENTNQMIDVCQSKQDFSQLPHNFATNNNTQLPISPPNHTNLPHTDVVPLATTPSRTSNHSERVCAGFTNQNQIKLRRSVSFDRRKVSETLIHGDNKDCMDGLIDNAHQPFNRNTVRAKYCSSKVIKQKFYIPESANIEYILRDPSDRRIKAICDRHNCDIEIYSKVPKSGFLKNIIILAAPNSESMRKCVRTLDSSMHWCLTPQLI